MSRAKEREQHAIKFMNELMRGIPEEERALVVYAEEATVQIDPETGKKINSGFWPKPHRADSYIRSEDNAYACICSAKKSENKKTGKMRYWRDEQSFGHGLAFFVDDIGEGKGSKGEMSLENWLERSKKTPPTVIVETSPKNYQCWYFFKEPIASMGQFKSFLYSFVNSVLEGAGGDVTIKDVTRVGRMPYGINNKRNSDGSFKYLDENGRPFRVNLHFADYSRRYTMEEIADSLKFEIKNHISTIRRTDDEEAEERMKGILAAIENGASEDVRRMAQDKAKWMRMEREYNEKWFRMAWDILDDAQQGEGADGKLVENQSGKIRIKCPLGHEHSNGDPYGGYFRSRIPGAEHEYVAGCAHDIHRKEKGKFTWSTFVDVVVMPAIFDDLDIANNYWANIEDMPVESPAA